MTEKVKLKVINRAECRVLGDEVATLAKALEERYNVKVTRGKATYGSGGNMSIKVEIALIDEATGTVATPEAEAFQQLAHSYGGGLQASDLGREFTSSGKRYKVIGLRPRAGKRPIICEEIATGKQFVFPAASVAQLLKFDASKNEGGLGL